MLRKRIIFCTYPSLYSDIVLDELLKSEQVELVGAVLSTRVLSKHYHKLQASLQQIRQSGLRYSIYLFVITDVYATLRWILRKKTLTKRLQQAGIPILNTADINHQQSINFIRQQQPDILLSAHFNQLIGKDILDLEEVYCLNIHPSLLPAYKGVDPAFYAMLCNEQQTGVTVHYQAETFDTGRILEQQPVKIWWHDSLLSLNTKLFKLGVLGFLQKLENLPNERGTAQAGEGNYDSWPTPDKVKQFRTKRKLWRWKELLKIVQRHSVKR